MRRTLPLLALALLAGCTVGPNYQRPPTTIAPDWVEPSANGTNVGTFDARWWDSFGDPVLSELVGQALKTNWDLAEARARIAETRANRDAAAGKALPQINATGSYTTNEISENGELPIKDFPGFPRQFPLWDFGFDASWEIDLWGKARRETEAAEARAEAAQWNRRDLALGITAEVARAYIDLRSAQAQAALAQRDFAANEDLATLTALRRDHGEANSIDASEASNARDTSRHALEQARGDIASAAYRIATLLGVAPETIVPRLTATAAPVPLPPPTIARGIRSDLLERRPDIREAERQLAASSADIGAAKADLFPRVSITGSLGRQAQNPGDLGQMASTRYGFGPSFSWPIFDAGRIRAQVHAADARSKEAEAAYEKAVSGALSDSESAANRYARTAAGFDAATRALNAEQQGYALATLRNQRGEDDRLAIDRAELRLLSAQQAERTARVDYGEAAIALYKSLGGGWEAE
jgi:NodT family efflux transporter outer membrane factor (OMF) lipoprotein